jgi:hypothetical protein
MLNTEASVLFATVDMDMTLSPRETMRAEGKRLANDLRMTVTARDPITDELLATFKPDRNRLFKAGDRVVLMQADLLDFEDMPPCGALGVVEAGGGLMPESVMVTFEDGICHECAPSWLNMADAA